MPLTKTRIDRFTGTLALGLIVAAATPGCGPEEPGLFGDESPTERTTQAVTGGTTQANPWFVVKTVRTGSFCSGTIYNRRWVITAAHCIPASWDENGSGTISAAELQRNGGLRIEGGPNSSGKSQTFSADEIRKPPGAKWDQHAGTNDYALVRISTSGFFPEKVAGFEHYYHTGSNGAPVLNLFPWRTTDMHPTSLVNVYGYSRGNLQGATAKVQASFEGWFDTVEFNGGGMIEHGDSGGPAFFWGRNIRKPGDTFYHVGVNSVLVPGHASHTGTAHNREWIEAQAGK